MKIELQNKYRENELKGNEKATRLWLDKVIEILKRREMGCLKKFNNNKMPMRINIYLCCYCINLFPNYNVIPATAVISIFLYLSIHLPL